MKKSKIAGIIGLCLLAVVITSTRSEKAFDTRSVSKNYKNISRYGLTDFINMDLGLIGFFPTPKHWTRITDEIKTFRQIHSGT